MDTLDALILSSFRLQLAYLVQVSLGFLYLFRAIKNEYFSPLSRV